MGLDEFVDDIVHGFFIFLGVGKTANRSKTLEPSLVSRSLVTLPETLLFRITGRLCISGDAVSVRKITRVAFVTAIIRAVPSARIFSCQRPGLLPPERHFQTKELRSPVLLRIHSPPAHPCNSQSQSDIRRGPRMTSPTCHCPRTASSL